MGRKNKNRNTNYNVTIEEEAIEEIAEVVRKKSPGFWSHLFVGIAGTIIGVTLVNIVNGKPKPANVNTPVPTLPPVEKNPESNSLNAYL